MRSVVIALVCIVALVQPALAQSPDPSGKWDVTFNTQQGPTNAAMTLKKDGEKLSGTIVGPPPSAVSPTGAAEASLNGTWTLDVNTGAGSGTPTVTFKQEGEKLTGQYSGQFGVSPLTGTVKGNAFTFQIEVAVEGTNVRVVYAGTVDKDSMKGTVTFGDLAEGTFTGKRK